MRARGGAVEQHPVAAEWSPLHCSSVVHVRVQRVEVKRHGACALPLLKVVDTERGLTTWRLPSAKPDILRVWAGVCDAAADETETPAVLGPVHENLPPDESNSTSIAEAKLVRVRTICDDIADRRLHWLVAARVGPRRVANSGAA